MHDMLIFSLTCDTSHNLRTCVRWPHFLCDSWCLEFENKTLCTLLAEPLAAADVREEMCWSHGENCVHVKDSKLMKETAIILKNEEW